MRLSLSERWRLHRIEVALRRADPHLAAVLSIFTRLTVRDPMPGHERRHASEPRTGLMG
jgi:Protein of unknown function (DUF3040)